MSCRRRRPFLVLLLGFLGACSGGGGDGGGQPPAAVSAAESTLAAAAAPVVADGSANVAIAAVARDGAGAPLAGRRVVFAVTGSANLLSAAEVITGPDGSAAATLASTKAEGKIVSATIDGVAVAQTAPVTFVAGPAVAATSTVSAPAVPAVAGGTAGATVTVTARDAHGNPVEGATLTLAASSGVLSAASVQTGPEGTAAATVTSTAAVPVTITGTLGGVPLAAPAIAFFAPGPAAKLAFDLQPSDAIAGEVLPAVEVLVVDAHGNPVASGTHEIGIALLAAPGEALAGTRTAYAIGGRARFPDLRVRLARALHALVATDVAGDLAAGRSSAFRVAAAGPAVADVTAPATVVAGADAAVGAVVRDEFGNPVEGALIAFAATGSANTFSAAAATDAGGATGATFSSTRAEAKTVSARVSGGSLTLGTASVTVTAAAPSALRSTLVVDGLPTASDDGTGIRVVLLVKDAHGNPVSGVDPTFEATGGAQVADVGEVTSLAGIVAADVSSLVSGPSTVTATVDGIGVVASTDVTFTPAPPSAVDSTLALDRPSAPANGITPVVATVAVRDTASRPMAGKIVQIAYSGVATLTPTTATTDPEGVATFQLVAASATAGAVSAKVSPGTASELLVTQTRPLAFAGCPAGDAYCGAEVCKDLDTDLAHCGACGDPCGPLDHATAVCTAGACLVDTCDPGYGDCDPDAGGCETDVRESEAHCGACGSPCAAGETCSDGLCVPPEFVSDGSEGALHVTAGTTRTLASGVHQFTSINVEPGATVVLSPIGNTGILELRATGLVAIEGTVDLSGGPGGNSTTASCTPKGGGVTAVRQTAPGSATIGGGGSGGGTVLVGFAGGNGQTGASQPLTNGALNGGGGAGGFASNGGECDPVNGGGGGSGWGGGAGGGYTVNDYECGAWSFAGGPGGGPSGGTSSSAGGSGGAAPYDGGAGIVTGNGGAGGGGSIGVSAASDLALVSTFRPGSGGGGGMSTGGGGGGGGGALRIASLTGITIAGAGRVLADGGPGGEGCIVYDGSSGGGGSGGVVDLAAPTVTMLPGAKVSAAGGAGGAGLRVGGAGGLGRIRISANPATSSAAGAVLTPPLQSGLVPGEPAPGYTYVRAWP